MNREELRDEVGLYEPLTPEEAAEIRRTLDRLLGRLAFDTWHVRHQDLPHADDEVSPGEVA